MAQSIYSPSSLVRGGHVWARPRKTQSIRCQVAVGIDLGTSNSAIGIIRQGSTPQVLRLSSNCYTAPSVVNFGKDATIVGQVAQSNAVVDPVNTFSSVKRLLGRRWEEVADMAPLLPYVIQEGADGGVLIHCPALDRPVTPQEVSSEVLKYLLAEAQVHTGQKILQAVITVPAYFGEQQRAATIEAGEMAGLLRVSLLQEPVAAALAHGFGQDPHAADTILVADLGGGTFDVSLLDGFEGILEVLATDGDAQLGGDDFDRALVGNILSSSLVLETSAAIRSDPRHFMQLVQSVEAARVALSHQDTATIDLPLPGTASSSGSKHVEISRTEFEQVTLPLMRRMWTPLERLAQATFTEYARRPHFVHQPETPSTSKPPAPADKWAPPPRRVTGVVLVGGASQTPAVKQLVRDITGLEARGGVDPSTCVALGATIQAGVMTGLLEEAPELMDGNYVMSLHSKASGFQY